MDVTVTLTDEQLIAARDACTRRARELDRRLERTSYAGKPGMQTAAMNERDRCRAAAAAFENARRRLADEIARRVGL